MNKKMDIFEFDYSVNLNTEIRNLRGMCTILVCQKLKIHELDLVSLSFNLSDVRSILHPIRDSIKNSITDRMMDQFYEKV